LAPELAGRLEVQPPTRAGDGSRAPKVVQQMPNENRVGGDIPQQSFASALV
jgi:hypothetical protein